MFEESSRLIFKFAEYGHLGVPMFFVISGYVITFSAESNLKNNKNPINFLRNRFLRIYPTFWASIVVVLFTPYLIALISYFKTGELIIPDTPAYNMNISEWLNFITLTKVFLASTSDLQAEFNIINSVYWTLAIEFQFYLAVFAMLYFKNYYRMAILLLSLACLLNLIFELPLNYGIFVHYWPSFSIGILLAYIHKFNFRFNFRKKQVAASTLLIMAYYLLYDTLLSVSSTLAFSIMFALIMWLIADLEKILTAIKNGTNKIMYFTLEAFLLTGTMSYTVYLLHGKIYLLPNMFVRQVLDSNNILFGALTIIGTLIVCFPFYFFVERRFLSKNYAKLHGQVLTRTLRGGQDAA